MPGLFLPLASRPNRAATSTEPGIRSFGEKAFKNYRAMSIAIIYILKMRTMLSVIPILCRHRSGAEGFSMLRMPVDGRLCAIVFSVVAINKCSVHRRANQVMSYLAAFFGGLAADGRV